jgi:hypothetical protein
MAQWTQQYTENINMGVVFVIGHEILEKFIPHSNKYKYRLEWHYLE